MMILKDMGAPTYKLAKPIGRHTLSAAEIARIAHAYGAAMPPPGHAIPVTVYPAGKRRTKANPDALPIASRTPSTHKPVGAPFVPARMRLGNGMRQVNWDAFGSGMATRSGGSARLGGREAWDATSTNPFVEEHDTTYRWDHRPSAYVYRDHAPGLRMCKRTSAYGATVDHAYAVVEISRREPVPVERRKPRAHRGIILADKGLAS